MRGSDIVSCDFETRSAVDLRKTGVYKYAADPSTDIWCLAYKAPWSDDVLVWQPGDAIDPYLEDWILAGGLLSAWNSQFERIIWNEIMVGRYQWPATKIKQWRCTMAQASAMGLPRALGQAAAVLGVEEQKDKTGAALMLRMARPRKVNADGSYTWWNTKDKIEQLIQYCRQDVRTELSVAETLNAMPDAERRLYQLDQRINDRGVALDVDLVHRVKALAGNASVEIDTEIQRLTKGQVKAATNGMDLVAWLNSHGIATKSVDKQTVARLLTSDKLHPVIRQVLTLRQNGAKSSTAKYDAMLHAVNADGRMRGLLVYHGAATGRWSGKLVQPQNFPRPQKKQDELDEIIAKLKADKDVSEHGAGTVLASDLLRSMLIAEDGHRLMFADYSAIEARVLAWVAGQSDLVETFRKGGDVYKEMASAIYNVDVESVTDAQRQVGKMAILGCFEEDTLVLTEQGWKPIVYLTTQDRVWDGEEWVTHQGVVYQGYKEVHRVNGVGATPDHEVLTEDGWQEWQKVHTNPFLLKSALSLVNLPYGHGSTTNGRGILDANALVGGLASLIGTIFSGANRRAVTTARSVDRVLLRKNITATRPLYQMTSIVNDYSTVSPLVSSVAKIQTAPRGSITEGGAFEYTRNGYETAKRFYRTFSHLMDGTRHIWNWIASTTTQAISPAISALSRGLTICLTVAQQKLCRMKSTVCVRKSHVYDVSYAGPRNRFTILTDSGPLIVHNCGYGMGGKRFAEQCASMGIKVDEDEAKRIVAVYREKNHRIAQYWRDIELEFVEMVKGAGRVGTVPLPLPSGRSLTYHNPRIIQRETPWGAMRDTAQVDTLNSVTRQWVSQIIWGGLLTENVVQATARDIMATAMMALEVKGYNVILSVHDEIISEVPDDFGSLEEMIDIMTQVPAWAQGCPINAEGKEGKRYRK